jgi:hypothetical protein
MTSPNAHVKAQLQRASAPAMVQYDLPDDSVPDTRAVRRSCASRQLGRARTPDECGHAPAERIRAHVRARNPHARSGRGGAEHERGGARAGRIASRAERERAQHVDASRSDAPRLGFGRVEIPVSVSRETRAAPGPSRVVTLTDDVGRRARGS